MTAAVSEVYEVIEELKLQVKDLTRSGDVSPLLVWMLLRQVADFELLKIKESEGLLDEQHPT